MASQRNPFQRKPEPPTVVDHDIGIHEDESTAEVQNDENHARRRNPFPSSNPNSHQPNNQQNGSPAGHNENHNPANHHVFENFSTSIPNFANAPRPLNSRDVCAFIINQMVGTGIYTTPPVVLLLTRSKGEALGLWFLGFVYTLVSMVIYLEFARKLPHTGGELIYLDETLPRPRMLAYTMYTFYFVLIYNTATNSMQFATQVLTAAAGDNPSPDLDPRALRFIAIVALSFFCLLHYFSGRAGRDLNQILALIKTLFLVILFFAGVARASGNFTADWNHEPNRNASSAATAFLSVVFSFSGWENATFVTSEIASHKILKRGFVSAIFIVGGLYMLINIIFLLAVPADIQTTRYAPLFFGDGYKARVAWSVLVAISASGSLLSVSYTCARVKQVIGMSNIIPWSRLWKSNSPPRTDADGNMKEPGTPQGGLLLHWTFSVILISVTSVIERRSEAISFPGNLQSYAGGWVGIFISLGFPFLFLEKDSRFFKFFRLTPRKIPNPSQERWNLNPDGQPGQSYTLKKTYLIFAFAYFITNGFVVIVPLIPPYENSLGQPLEVKGWYYIVIVFCVFSTALIYYCLVFGRANVRSGGTYAELVAESKISPQYNKSIVSAAGVHLEIIEEDVHNPQYGNRRTVHAIVHDENPSFIYWFFGGSDKRHWRALGISDLWDWALGRT